MLVDQPVPFLAGTIQKRAAKNDCEDPATKKGAESISCKRFRGQMDRQAARQQADRVEDGRFKHFPRSRSCEAFPYIEQIRHDKDREDRRFGNDESSHRDLASIGKPPGCRRLREISCYRTHAFFLYS
jgi:hypothetical protein